MKEIEKIFGIDKALKSMRSNDTVAPFELTIWENMLAIAKVVNQLVDAHNEIVRLERDRV